MLFQTPEFAVLLAFSWLAFNLLKGRARLWVMLLASLCFYAYSGPIDTLVFLVAVFLTFYAAKKLGGTGSRPVLLAILGALFLNLAVFKYGSFLYDNANSLLNLLGFPLLIRRPVLWLPLGISFYTFQLAAYAIDVHRREVPPSEDLVEFMTFIMFFGQLVAGPIMRARDFLWQLREKLSYTKGDLQTGFFLIIRGLVKKVAIADRLSLVVDPMFGAATTLNHASSWLAAYLFAFQIYLDFSGYTDIGIGLGRLFGLRLSANFLSPYMAGNPSEFWRRWHITLSTWLRDYLYIPLGGNRCSAYRHAFNLMATMLLGGLWHGAAWTFVIWGGFQGLMMMGHGYAAGRWGNARPLHRIVAVALNFQAMALGWMLFRAQSIADVAHMWAQALDFRQFSTWAPELPLVALFVGCYSLHVLEWYADANSKALALRWHQFPAPLRGLVYAVVVFLVILILTPAQPFIYFRF